MGSIQRTARTALQGFQKQKKAMGVNESRIPFAFMKRQRINKMVRKLTAKRASRLQIKKMVKYEQIKKRKIYTI